jgi:two-component system, OmpR family, response regulator RegX3
VKTPRVLIVEDEEAVARPLAAALRREGFAPRVAPTASQALEELVAWRPNAMVLDVMLPDGDGRDVCREVRTRSDIPVVIVTARGDPIDRVVGLELGADDYVVKPFSSRELAARLRAVLRRGRAEDSHAPIEVGPVWLDPATRTATRSGETLRLPAREFDLLHLLLRHAGRVVRREAIMDELWGADWFGSSKTLDVHIARLRDKIEDDPARPERIVTVRGVGFRYAAERDEQAS